MEKPKSKEKTIEVNSHIPNAKTIKKQETLDEILQQLSETGRKLLDLTARRDKAITKAKETYKTRIVNLQKKAASLFESIATFSQPHREEILPPERKSVQLNHGVIGWRATQPRIELKVEKDVAIAFLKQKRLRKYIRIEEYVDIEGILKDPEAIKKISSIIDFQEAGETFYVKPEGVQLKFTRYMKAAVLAISKVVSPKQKKKK